MAGCEIRLEFDRPAVERMNRAIAQLRRAADRYPEAVPLLLQLLYVDGDPEGGMRPGLVEFRSMPLVRGGVLPVSIENAERFDWIVAHAAAGDLVQLRALLDSCDDPPPPL